MRFWYGFASIVVAGGVALAGGVLWRLASGLSKYQVAVRWMIAALTTYGVVAFLIGAIAGTPMSTLLSGAALWARLPLVLQGTFIGGVIILPVALIASIVRQGVPRFRRNAPRPLLYQMYQTIALATSCAIVFTTLPVRSVSRASSEPDAAAYKPIVPSPELSASLENSLRAIEDGERTSPRDRWDPRFVVQQVGSDPEALFRWVRDNTTWIPYHGILRGPIGVLMDRRGNSLDRALLLGTLLREAGYTVRLAHGEIANDRAGAVLASLLRPVERPAMRWSESEVLEDVGSDLAKRRDDQVQRLTAAINTKRAEQGISAEFDQRLDAALAAVRDHWWVQRQDGANWVDLDVAVLEGDATPALAAASDLKAPDDLADLRHTIAVRVIAETWSGGSVSERKALEHVFVPSEVIGKPIVLQFFPTDWPQTLADHNDAMRKTALAQHEWRATLTSGRDVLAHATLGEAGDIESNKEPSPLGGLGAGLSNALGGSSAETPTDDQLTAVWIEYEIRAVGAAPRTIRRAVFDLLGPAARTAKPVRTIELTDERKLTRSLALTMKTEILPLVGELAPEFVTHLLAQSILGSRELLRATARGEESDDPGQVAKASVPVPSGLYALALTRFADNRFAADIFIDRPNVLTRHIYLEPSPTVVVPRDAIDIVANEIGVSPLARSGFAARLAQGVLDTNLEALIPASAVRRHGAAEAFARSRDWVTLGPDDGARVESLKLSDDVRRRITQQLAAGAIVVAPSSPIAIDRAAVVGWWSTNPDTGDTLGFDEHGWGGAQELAETAALMFVDAAISEFMFCEALHEYVAIVKTGADWATTLDTKTGKWKRNQSRFQGQRIGMLGSYRGCAISAVFAGVMATLPLLLIAHADWLVASEGELRVRVPGEPVDPHAKTQPDLSRAKTEPDLSRAKTEPDLSRAKTEPDLSRAKTEPDLSRAKTEPDPSRLKTEPGKPPTPQRPLTPDEARRHLQEAAAAQKAAEQRAMDATRDFVQYRANKPIPRANHPGDPSKWDPGRDQVLHDEMVKSQETNIQALHNLRDAQRAARDAAAAARGQEGRGGFPPAPKPNVLGCPPNCGNSNPTGPAGVVQAPGPGGTLAGIGSIQSILGGGR